MSDETSTAVIDAPVSTGSEASAPVSSPTPESTPTSTPNVTPVSTPSGESSSSAEFKAPTRNAGEGTAAYLKRTRELREAHAQGKPAEPVKAPEATPAAGEVKATETPKPAEAKTTEVSTEPDDLIPETGLATTELAEKVKNDPELAAALEKSGLKNALFANARLADKANQFIQQFPGGLEEVTFVKQHAAEREALETGFTSISAPADAGQFLREVVMPMSYVLGEDGKPISDGQGGFLNDGTVERFMENMVGLGVQLLPERVFQQVLANPKGKELLLNQVSSLASEGDDEMQAALEIVKDRLEKRGSSSAASAPQTEQQKQLAAERQQIDAEKQRLDQQRQAEQTQRETDNERAVATSISSDANKLIDQVLGKFAIPEFNKESAREKIRAALYDRINEDSTFKMQAAQLARKQYGTKSHQERVGLALRTAKSYLWSVAQPIVKAAGGELIAANQAKHTKITTQIDASKKEPKAGLTTPSGTPAQTKEQLAAQIRENLTKQGKEVSVANMLAERRRIQSGL